MFYELTTDNISTYLQSLSQAKNFVDVSKMKIKELSDTINSVYLVESVGFKPFILKQALPHFKSVREIKFSQHRIKNEYRAWEIYNHVASQYVPHIYYYDEDMCLFIMEYVENTLCLNAVLNKGIVLDHFADEITTFLSNVFFARAYSPEKNEWIAFFKENSDPCKKTVNVIFENWERQIVRVHDQNTPFSATRRDARQKAILKLQEKFQNQHQALIHGDLKGSAILIDPTGSIKLIDYEFAFFAPIGYDLGSLLCVFVATHITYSLYDGHKTYKKWLLDTIESIFIQFEKKCCAYAKEHHYEFDMPTILQESIGFAGVQMLMVKIPFFRLNSISRAEFSVRVEFYLKKNLDIADAFIANHEKINSIDDVIKMLRHI